MRSADSGTSAYLQAREGCVPRDLLWVEGRNRSTGEIEGLGLWSDVGAVEMTVISGQDGTPVSRLYYGSGTLVKISSIPLITDLTVRTVKVTLSNVSPAVEQMIRGYDPRMGVVEIHRALMDLDTRQLVGYPLPHFVGRVNKAPLVTPRVGSEGSVELTVVSHTRELTRINPAKKSDETQKRRSGDRARRYVGVASQWQIFWGESKEAIAPPPPPVQRLTDRLRNLRKY